MNNIDKLKRKYDDVDYFLGREGDELAIVTKKGKSGFINTQGDEVIPLIYEECKPFETDNRDLAFVKKDGKWGVINRQNHPIIPFIYEDRGTALSYGLINFKKEGKWGTVNENGDVVVPFVYEDMGTIFWDGFSRAKNYGDLGTISEDCFCGVKKDGKWGIVNNKAEEVVPCEFDNFYYYPGTDCFYVVNYQEDGSRKGYYVNAKGQRVVPCYRDSHAFPNGDYFIQKNGKFGLSKNNKEIIPYIYDEVTPFDNGLSLAKKDGKYGFINEKGEVVIPFIYDEGRRMFSCGYSIVKKDGKFGVINREGTELVPFEYDKIDDDSFCFKVFQNGKVGCIISRDKKLPCEYDEIEQYSVDISKGERSLQDGERHEYGEYKSGYLLTKAGKYGFADDDGNVIIPCEYEHIYVRYLLRYGIAYVTKNGEEFLVDKNGNEHHDKKEIKKIEKAIKEYSKAVSKIERADRYNKDRVIQKMKKRNEEKIQTVFAAAIESSTKTAKTKNKGLDL